MADQLGLRVSDADFNTVIGRALRIERTRDLFDRIIVAEAALADSILVAKDWSIRDHYLHARW